MLLLCEAELFGTLQCCVVGEINVTSSSLNQTPKDASSFNPVQATDC